MKNSGFRRILSVVLTVLLLLSMLAGCTTGGDQQASPEAYDALGDSTLSVEERAQQIVAGMTLYQKACQMVQAQNDAIYSTDMIDIPVGSVLSGGGDFSNSYWSVDEWKRLVDGYQNGILAGETPVPILYGIDAVHGVGKMQGAVVFPHNIGIGAANDPELTYQMAQAVANEMKLAGILLNFAPCVAVADDPRWGRTYECYSSDSEIVASLGTAFAEGLLSQGVMPCAKHFIGDGSTEYGTAYGSNGTPLDRGNTEISMDELRGRLLPAYESLIAAGVKVIMPSHGSVNGVRMHENKELLTDLLKGELGFEGFVISDWESVNELSGGSLDKNVVLAINAGVDMLMQPYNYGQVIRIISKAVENGSIPAERVDDAVLRIIKVKLEMGVIDDPYNEKNPSAVPELGSNEYRQLAQQLVEKSLVLLKNENQVLPLAEGSTVLVLGQALDDVGVQCGGWTGSWCGDTDENTGGIMPGITILDGIKEAAAKHNVTVITDLSRADEADVVIIGLGEAPYAEWYGDSDNISITGNNALADNAELIDFAKKCGKPVVTLLVAGRNVLVSDYIDNWDAVVMCYLPGSEGGAVAPVLFGDSDFNGKLPMPWYASNEAIGTENPDLLFEMGYGLSYN